MLGPPELNFIRKSGNRKVYWSEAKGLNTQKSSAFLHHRISYLFSRQLFSCSVIYLWFSNSNNQIFRVYTDKFTDIYGELLLKSSSPQCNMKKNWEIGKSKDTVKHADNVCSRSGQENIPSTQISMRDGSLLGVCKKKFFRVCGTGNGVDFSLFHLQD